MGHTIIGLSAFYHDSAVAVLRNGQIVCAAQEERFSRIKNDASFPAQALAWCCEAAGISSLDQVDFIVFHEKPLIKFERLIETWLDIAPRGLTQFTRSIPSWSKQKLTIRQTLKKDIRAALDTGIVPPLLFNDHHGSHAAAAFFSGPFDNAAVLCLDGVGEWDTSTAWVGKGHTLTPLWRIPFPHSLGLLYSAFTSFCGFRVNSGEYKLMGLAPYGEPIYSDLIESQLIDIRPDGSFRINMRYFDYRAGLRMTNRKFSNLFNGPPQPLGATPTRREMDMAASIQAVTEKVVLLAARHLQKITGMENLCLGGGVALNCMANGALQRAGIFKEVWVPPAPSDAGSAIGAALSAWHEFLGHPRMPTKKHYPIPHSYLGPAWKDEDIPSALETLGARFCIMDESELLSHTAELLAEGKVIGWFQGAMEFGPRALGNRSILGDPRDADMIKRLNLKIKHRESFRPFAPSVLEEQAHEWFDLAAESSPFMHTVASVASQHWHEPAREAFGLERINEKRSRIPAVTHVNMSARLHTVNSDNNPRFHGLISHFQDITGIPLLINTSFNVRGEPIVCTPEDAWKCFLGADMDVLVIGTCVLYKEKQAPSSLKSAYTSEFERD